MCNVYWLKQIRVIQCWFCACSSISRTRPFEINEERGKQTDEGIRSGPQQGSRPREKKMDGLLVDRWGGGSVMTAVCYDVPIQVCFDKTVLSTCVFIVSALSPSTKAGRWCVSVLEQAKVSRALLWNDPLIRQAHELKRCRVIRSQSRSPWT